MCKFYQNHSDRPHLCRFRGNSYGPRSQLLYFCLKIQLQYTRWIMFRRRDLELHRRHFLAALCWRHLDTETVDGWRHWVYSRPKQRFFHQVCFFQVSEERAFQGWQTRRPKALLGTSHLMAQIIQLWCGFTIIPFIFFLFWQRLAFQNLGSPRKCQQRGIWSVTQLDWFASFLTRLLCLELFQPFMEPSNQEKDWILETLQCASCYSCEGLTYT